MKKEKLKIGSYGQYRSFVDDRLEQSFMVQFVGFDVDGDYRFRINSSENEHLTISKKCFPKHEWEVGSGKMSLSRKTTIEMYK